MTFQLDLEIFSPILTPVHFNFPTTVSRDMASRNRIPAILEPFIQLPPELSQVLITSTLGCSATWLTARFIGAGLQRQDETLTSRDVQAESNVILVSWLRDHTFWESEIRRSMVIQG
jgi:elongator complex protein 6